LDLASYERFDRRTTPVLFPYNDNLVWLIGQTVGVAGPGAFTSRIDDRSAKGIAAAMSRMIRSGELAPNTKLPTVRAVAKELGVSPTTVSEAWQQLAGVGLVEAFGRNGTVVRRHRAPLGPRRYSRIAPASSLRLDLSTGVPDPALLPDLGRALGRVQRSHLTTSYLEPPLLGGLEELLQDLWPFPPEVLTVVDGAMDALDRVTQTIVRLGDRVIVEDPCFPPLLDLLEALGCEPIGVPVDGQGVTPEGLADALSLNPVAVFLQPRAHNPTGVSMTTERAAALAAVLSPTSVVIVEDDHAGDIAWAPPVSIGAWLPSRVVHVRGFSKSHGPDLRLAAVGGSGDVLGRMVERRLLGVGWSSRLIQAVLADLLADPVAVAEVASARSEYHARRTALLSALTNAGVTAQADDGINCWVAVDDERSAILHLALAGIGVAPGGPFCVATDSRHIRLTVGLVPTESAAKIAEAVAAAAHPTSSTRLRR
jgi:DNA-binding transcriptional MocR family regulator